MNNRPKSTSPTQSTLSGDREIDQKVNQNRRTERASRRTALQHGLGIGVFAALVLSGGATALFPTISHASLDAAMKAWAAGDYHAAAKLLKPRADEGDPKP